MKTTRAREVMTREVVTVLEDLPVSELARILSEHRILGAPVVDRKDRLVGVVIVDMNPTQGAVPRDTARFLDSLRLEPAKR